MRVRHLAIALACSMSAGCGDGPIHHSSDDLSAPVADMAVVPSHCTVGGGHVLSDLPGAHVTPRIAWNGTGFVVAWNTYVGATARVDVTVTDGMGAHLGPNLPLSPQPIARAESPPSLAPLTVGTVVAWTRVTGAASDIVIDTLDANGERLDANGVPCDPGIDGCGIFAVTSSGTAILPALGRTGRNPDGTPTDATVTLAYVDARNHCGTGGCDGMSDVFWTRVGADGSSVIAAQQITPAGSNVVSAFPRMAWDGSHDALVWRDDTQHPLAQFLFATIDRRGNVTSGPGLVATAAGQATRESVPDLVYAAGSFALVDATGDDTNAAVLLQRFDGTGIALLTPTPITSGVTACEPAIATDGIDYAIVWQSPCNKNGANILFTRVDATGKRLGPDMPITDLMPGSAAIAGRPSITATGDGYGVVWEQDNVEDGGVTRPDIWFARIDCT